MKVAGYTITSRQLVALHGLYKGLVTTNLKVYGVSVRQPLNTLADRGVIARTGMGAFMIPYGSPGDDIIRRTPDFVISQHL